MIISIIYIIIYTFIFIIISSSIAYIINKLTNQNYKCYLKLNKIINPREYVDFYYIGSQCLFILFTDIIFRGPLLIINLFSGYGIIAMLLISLTHIIYFYMNYKKYTRIMSRYIEIYNINLDLSAQVKPEVQLMIKIIVAFLFNLISNIILLLHNNIMFVTIPKLYCCIMINLFIKPYY